MDQMLTSWKQLLPFPQVSTVALDAKDEMDDVEDIVEILKQIGSLGKLALETSPFIGKSVRRLDQ